MTTEPYQKLGRGGAGNFYTKQSPQDLESQPATETETELIKTLSSQQPAAEYAHTGRGGAGNWVRPSDELFKASEDLPTTEAKVVIPERNSSLAGGGGGGGGWKATYRGGRGGAGNYEWRDDAEERKREKEEAERRRGEVDGVVGRALEGLREPGRVMVGGRDAREGVVRRGV